MTSKVLRYATVVCDGCGVVFGEPGEYVEVAAVRIASWDAGWRLIPKLGRNGRPARMPDLTNPQAVGRATSTASDVCRSCFPDFKPKDLNRPDSNNGKYLIDVHKRVRELEAEVAHLRGYR